MSRNTGRKLDRKSETIRHTEWSSEFFGPAYYENEGTATSGAYTQIQTDFILRRIIGLDVGRAVLDLGGGAGRHALLLAAAGYPTTVVDKDPYAMELLGAARSAGALISGILGDICQLEPSQARGPYDAVLCLHNSFGYEEDEDQHLLFLAAAARRMSARGRLVLEVLNRETVFEHAAVKIWRRSSAGGFVLGDYRADLVTGRLVGVEHRIPPHGSPSSHELSIRVYSLAELKVLLGRVNLRIRRTWGDWDGSTYAVRSARLILEAVRREWVEEDRP